MRFGGEGVVWHKDKAPRCAMYAFKKPHEQVTFPHEPPPFAKPRQKILFSKKKRERSSCYASTGELIKANDKHFSYDNRDNWSHTTIDGDQQNRSHNASDQLKGCEGIAHNPEHGQVAQPIQYHDYWGE